MYVEKGGRTGIFNASGERNKGKARSGGPERDYARGERESLLGFTESNNIIAA